VYQTQEKGSKSTDYNILVGKSGGKREIEISKPTQKILK
jgi:hypothetical protein